VAHAWEQQPGEGPKAFDAFRSYIALPRSERSIDAAYRGTGSGKRRVRRVSGRAPRRWFSWSSRYRWTDRAAEYDAHADAIAQTAREDRIRQLAIQRLDFEIAQLPLLQKAHERIVTALDVQLHIARGPKGARTINPFLFDIGYARLLKLLLVYGREIVNGPRKVDKAKADEKSPPSLADLSHIPDAELDVLVQASRKLRELTSKGPKN
jgi:hypothetical protein